MQQNDSGTLIGRLPQCGMDSPGTTADQGERRGESIGDSGEEEENGGGGTLPLETQSVEAALCPSPSYKVSGMIFSHSENRHYITSLSFT